MVYGNNNHNACICPGTVHNNAAIFLCLIEVHVQLYIIKTNLHAVFILDHDQIDPVKPL